MKNYVKIISLLLLVSCGYRFPSEKKQVSICVPFIKGDSQGVLTQELCRQIALCKDYKYAHKDADYILDVSVQEDESELIGFKYDQDVNTGARIEKLIPTENRRILKVLVKVIDKATSTVVFGPAVFSASSDYDYVDENSIKDLSFTDARGDQITSLQFSMGQLDSKEGAEEAAFVPLCRTLAKKILNSMATHNLLEPL